MTQPTKSTTTPWPKLLRNGIILNHLGLTNERYADYFIEARSLEERGEEHLKKAVQYYKEWGAEAKVKMVEFRLKKFEMRKKDTVSGLFVIEVLISMCI